jgi:hypothetical protein
MTTIAFAVAIMLSWALVVVACSRWKYGLALLAGLACYAAAFALARVLGAGAVGNAWVVMAAIGAIISSLRERARSDGSKVPLIPSSIATFIVGLLAWPLVFPGIRTPKADQKVVEAATTTATPTMTPRAVVPIVSDDDDDDEPEPARAVASLQTRPGAAMTSVAFATPLSILFGNRDLHAAGVEALTLARATATTPAYARETGGAEVSWDERAGVRFLFSDFDRGGGNFVLLDRNGDVLLHLARTRLPIVSRDQWYALAAAFGRLYEGAVVVEDSLVGLDA